MKLGLDVHALQITVCVQEGGLLPKPSRKMEWAQFYAFVEGLLGKGHRICSCYEAGPCGYGLHRKLTELGVTNYVVAPQRWDEQGKRVKTDKIDARELCDRLDRYVRGNTHAFTVVMVPTIQQEQERALCRQRGSVLRERNRCIVRCRGLMLSQGIIAAQGWWKEPLWTSFGQELPQWLHDNVALWRAQVLELDKQLQALNKRVERLSEGRVIPKGVGKLSSAILQAEVLDWNRFKNRGQIGHYTGLCPSEDSSDKRRRQGSVNKHGNPRVRHVLVEAAWRLSQWQPSYPPLRKLRGVTSSRMKKRIITAAARRLAVDLWRINTGQCSAQKLGLMLTCE
jgi:transposase